MTPALKTIRLYGAPGPSSAACTAQPSQRHAEAVRALCTLLPGFERRMLDKRRPGRALRPSSAVAIWRGRTRPARRRAGRDPIAPMPAGAKRGGLFQAILGGQP